MHSALAKLVFGLAAFTLASSSVGQGIFAKKRTQAAHPSLPQECWTPGYVCSRIHPGETAAVYMVRFDCLDDKGVRYHETYVQKITWLKPLQQPDGIAISHYPNPLYTDLSASYTFTTPASLPFGQYVVDFISTQSEHCNGWFFDWYLEVIPTINSSTTDLWWFGNGSKPPGWNTSVNLRVEPSRPGTYDWKIKSGADKVKFSNGTDAISTTEPSVDVFSKGRSVIERDVAIVVSAGGVESSEYRLTVRAPKYLVPNGTKHQPNENYGYMSVVSYLVKDQFEAFLPINFKIPINESFKDDLTYDYQGSNWRRGDPGGVETYADQFRDEIQGEAVRVGMIPEPQAPQKPLGRVKISHFTGYWSIGSTEVGKGIRIQRNVWQKFQDHAIHQNITSPVQ